MKKLQIVSIILLFSAKLFSQQYKPLLVEGNRWNYLEIQIPMCACPAVEFTNCYMLGADSIINNLTYTKIYETKIAYDEQQGTQYVGCLREDVDNQEVYFIKSNENQEQIIYSFNVNVNDFVILLEGGNIKKVVTDIGTYNFNGVSGKKITICTTRYGKVTEEYWFEGIGSSLEFLPLTNWHSDWDGVLCFYNNNDLLYDSKIRPNCQGVFTSLNNAEGSIINIFPNPTASILTVETTLGIESIEIYNITGRLVFKTLDLVLDLSEFDNGVYFVIISLKSGERLQKKIVIKS